VAPTSTNTPLTASAILPDPAIPRARKTSGWGNAAFGLGFQSGAPSKSWHSSRSGGGSGGSKGDGNHGNGGNGNGKGSGGQGNNGHANNGKNK
jgi:hypothetical protein